MNSESGILPRQAMLAAIALLVVTIGILPSSGLLDPGRPVFRGVAPVTSAQSHSHVMRSAADPFGGVTLLTGQDPKFASSCPDLGAELTSGLGGTASSADRPGDGSSSKPCVVIVVTPTEPYPEAEERRRCDRIAMHLAAWEAGYEAIDPDRVKHCRLPPANRGTLVNGGEDAGHTHGQDEASHGAAEPAACEPATEPSEPCIIEYLRPRPLARAADSMSPATVSPGKWSKIAVVWIGSHELEGGLELHEKLDAICGSIPSDAVDVRLIGPPYSGDLRALVESVRRSSAAPSRHRLAWCDRTHWISPTATISDGQLGLAQASDAPCARPIPKDDNLIGLIGDELLRRRSPLAQHAVLPVIVFHEIDSEYGRALGEIAQTKLQMPLGKKPRFQVTTVPYLRGLDGSGPGSQGRPAESATRSPSNSTLTPSVATLTDLPNAMQQLMRASRGEDPAFGSDRSDYVRRLADVLANRQDADGKAPRPIFAIGLLGTDYYDTLSLLQGLRTRFPEAIFFSLELDARMLNPKHQRWTRNLIVASTGGLESSSMGPGGLPNPGVMPHSFRNDAQRSFFECARHTLAGTAPSIAPVAPSTPGEGEATSESEHCGTLFEIGRWTPVKLEHGTSSKAANSPRWLAALLAAGIGIAVILAYGHLTSFPRRDPEDASHHQDAVHLPVGGTTAVAGRRGPEAAPARRRADRPERRAPTPPKRVLRDIWLLRRRAPRILLYLLCLAIVLVVNAWIRSRNDGTLADLFMTAIASLFRAPLAYWVVTIVASLGLSLSLYGLHYWVGRLGVVNPQSPLRLLLSGVGVLIIAGLVVLAPYYMLQAAFVGGEPTTWIEGVSVIPTNVIRLLCMFVALGTMTYFWSRLSGDMRAIERDYLPRRVDETNDRPTTSWQAFWDGIKADPNDDIAQPTVRGLWHVLRLRSTWVATSIRVLFVATLWILSVSVIFSVWPVKSPARGAETFMMDLWCTIGVISSVTVLNFLIWDRICRCNRFIRLLTAAKSNYAPEVLRTTGLPHPLATSIIDINIIARITELPRRLLFVPILLFVIASIARSSVFDNWYMNPALAFALALSLGLTIYGAMILRMTAQGARRHELERLERLRAGAVREATNENEYTLKDIDLVKATIAGTRQGPFEDLLHEPTTQAILIAMIPLGLSVVVNAVSVW